MTEEQQKRGPRENGGNRAASAHGNREFLSCSPKKKYPSLSEEGKRGVRIRKKGIPHAATEVEDRAALPACEGKGTSLQKRRGGTLPWPTKNKKKEKTFSPPRGSARDLCASSALKE